MAGTYFVQPGAAQQFSGAALSAGSVIVNNDTVNSVWLGSDQTVQPSGNGVELPPLATAQWTGKQLWACVDTGVASPVSITASGDISQIDNPIAVATATALALELAGIPNVFLQDLLYTGTISNGSALTPPVNVSKYASLTVLITPTGAASDASPTWAFDDILQTVTLASGDIQIKQVAGAIAVTIPVAGPLFFIIWAATNVNTTLGIIIYGTNRIANGYSVLSRHNNVKQVIATQAWVAGVVTFLGSIAMNGGITWMEFSTGGTTVKGQWELLDASGTGITIILATTTDTNNSTAGGQSVQKQIPLPVGIYGIQFRCATAAAAGTTIAVRMVGGTL